MNRTHPTTRLPQPRTPWVDTSTSAPSRRRSPNNGSPMFRTSARLKLATASASSWMSSPGDRRSTSASAGANVHRIPPPRSSNQNAISESSAESPRRTRLPVWTGSTSGFLWPWFLLRAYTDLTALVPGERDRVRDTVLSNQPDA